MRDGTKFILNADDRMIVLAAIESAQGDSSQWDTLCVSQHERAKEILKQIEHEWIEDRMLSS